VVVSFSRSNKLFEGVAMRKVVVVLLLGLMLFTPVSQTLGDSIEVRGNLYDKLGLPTGDGPGTLNLFQGKIGAGLTPSAGACGVNAGFSFLYGIQNSLGAIDQFISNWQTAGTAVALYTLATYLPIAKEALLGANTLSNFLAQLRGFSCSQTMETIKELNYQDSFLIKKCIAKRLGISEGDVDVTKSKDPQEWYNAYKQCLNSANIVDLFGGDKDSALKYLKFISPRSLARCYLGVRRDPTAEEIAKADLQTRAKYFLYMVLPDITLSGNGLLNIQTATITDPNTGQKRPATMMDVMNFHVESFVQDYKQLIEDLKPVIKFEMGHKEALEASQDRFKEFERKYNISVEDMSSTLVLILRMRDYLQRGAKGEFEGNPLQYEADLMKIDHLLNEYVMKNFLDKALYRLEMVLNDELVRLKQAEEMRKAVGSGNIPGDKDGCFDDSSGGST
jgi:hypothetical protein